MTSPTQNALRVQLATLLEDLRVTGSEDGEAMFMLGAGADRLASLAEVQSWSELKAKLIPADVLALLQQIDLEGKQALADDKIKHAYALQALGMSLAATGNADPLVRAGAELVDQVIEETLTNYRNYAANAAGAVN